MDLVHTPVGAGAAPGLTILRSARLWGDPRDQPLDVALRGGRIAAVGEQVARLVETEAVGAQIRLDGRWLMPGLVDNHVHFTLWAKHRARLDVSGTRSAAQVAHVVEQALGSCESDLLVGRGFQDALWFDAPTAAMLDEAAERAGATHVGIVLLSHDLHTVWVSTLAARRLGSEAGLLREAEAFELEIAVESFEATDVARVDRIVADAVAAASARGVTGIMDLEMADNPTVWARRVAGGVTALRVRAGVYPEHLEASLSRHERTGTVIDASGRALVTVGPLKVFADGALNTRTAWCVDEYPMGGHGHAVYAQEDLRAVLAHAREVGFEVALHAIGDRAVADALDAFEATGAVGTVEHAQLIRPEDLPRFARLGVAAGIHPEHALDDRHVTDVMWAGRTQRAFPYGALARAGAQLRMGSDAPVSPLDPWFGISAAVHRTRDALEPWEIGNALTLTEALHASWAIPSIAAGQRADLIAVDRDPAEASAVALRELPVALTITDGAVTHIAV